MGKWLVTDTTIAGPNASHMSKTNNLPFRSLEILLLEIAFYIVLWLLDEYIATLLSLILGSIFLLLLLFALVAEWIERSKVPRWYFWFMLVSVLAPLAAAVIYLAIQGGLLWLQP